MCLAPQRRALFRHLNFQKCFEREVFLAFHLQSASHHNGVQLFISHLATWLCTRRFSEPTFPPSGATTHWKNAVYRDFLTFSRTFHLLSSDSFSSLIFSLLLFLLFSSLTLPASAFPSVHVVGSLTSKLPSVEYSSIALFWKHRCDRPKEASFKLQKRWYIYIYINKQSIRPIEPLLMEPQKLQWPIGTSSSEHMFICLSGCLEGLRLIIFGIHVKFRS